MGVEENLLLVDRAVRAFNDLDIDGYLGLFAEDLLLVRSDLPEPVEGRQAYRKVIEAMTAALPDLRSETVRVLGQGAWVCGEFILTGTHRGPLTGPEGEALPATGNTVRFGICILFRCENGKIVEYRGYFDRLALLGQVGYDP